MNLILLERSEIAADGAAILRGERARHVREVLKAARGATVRVGAVDGPMGTATVEGDDGGGCVRIRCRLAGGPQSPPPVDVLLAMPRPKAMNRLWPVLASLGVGRIAIVGAWKTERSYFDSHVLEPDRVRAGLIEGLQQAGDTRLPQVSVHRSLRELLEEELEGFGTYAARLAAHPGEGAFPYEWLRNLPQGARMLVAIGPEGGWTEGELERLAAHGFEPASWGPRTLRTDTACAVLLGLAHAALGHPRCPF
jgi:16S rRNA (uracil1498-N3)-methyltransferase